MCYEHAGKAIKHRHYNYLTPLGVEPAAAWRPPPPQPVPVPELTAFRVGQIVHLTNLGPRGCVHAIILGIKPDSDSVLVYAFADSQHYVAHRQGLTRDSYTIHLADHCRTLPW